MKYQVTSYLTKRALADALKKAMSEKPFSKVTVSEVVRLSGVNRKTFYYHFEDIFSLLKWMFEEEAFHVVESFDLSQGCEEAIRFIMDYVEENHYILLCAFDGISRGEMRRFFYRDFHGVVCRAMEEEEKRRGIFMDAEFKEYLAMFYTEALAGMLLNWVESKERRDREKTVQYLSAIITHAQKLDHPDLFPNPAPLPKPSP